MLEDLSCHVLDIAENSIAAEASRVGIEMLDLASSNLVSMKISDNGRGMTPDFLARVTNPFTTTRTTRQVGLGLPFLKQAAELCGGRFDITSEPGKGTTTYASFARDNIDLPPMGDMASTVTALFMGHPEIDWTYVHRTDAGEYSLSTEELIEALEDRELLRTAEVGQWIKEQIAEGLREIS